MLKIQLPSPVLKGLMAFWALVLMRAAPFTKRSENLHPETP